MLNLIKQLLEKWACKHEWKLEIKSPVYLTRNGEQIGKHPKAIYYVYVCQKCGKLEKITL